MAEENVIRFKIETEDTSIEGTRKKIEALKSEMLATTDADTFNKLALQAGGLETEIRRVEDAVTSLAGSGSELTKMSNSFSRVGASLLSMDFGAAAEEAGRLAAISKTMNFGTAISSLKSLGSTFMSLGKALLTNPFFLLVGVITAIVVGIVKLMDELGILTAIFEAVGDAIGWVIQQIKDLLDWLGLTDYAGEEQLQNQIERNDKLAESIKKLTSETATALEHEIELRRIAGEDTTELEREKLEMIKASLREQVVLAGEKAKAIIKLHGADSEEFKAQKEALDLLVLDWKSASRQIEIFEATQVAKEKASLEATEKAKEDKRKEWAAKRKEREEKERQERLKKELEEQEIAHKIIQAFLNDASAEQKESLKLEIQELEGANKTKMSLMGQFWSAVAEGNKETAEEERALDMATEQMKTDLTNQSFAALQANLKQGSKLSKGVALAQATFDTFKGVQAIFANAAANPATVLFPAQPFIAAAAALTFGLANVRSILATPDIATGAPSGGSTFSPPSLGGSSGNTTPTPSMNLNDGVEQTAGGSVNRVMVVDYTDIEKKGKQVNMLQNRVSLI